MPLKGIFAVNIIPLGLCPFCEIHSWQWVLTLQNIFQRITTLPVTEQVRMIVIARIRQQESSC